MGNTKIVKVPYNETPYKSNGKKGLLMQFEKGIEEDRRMAAFLQSKDYKGESWLTDELWYLKWVEAGRPIEVPVIKGFKQNNDKTD